MAQKKNNPPERRVRNLRTINIEVSENPSSAVSMVDHVSISPGQSSPGTRKNGANGIRDIEGKAARVAARKRGKRTSFNIPRLRDPLIGGTHSIEGFEKSSDENLASFLECLALCRLDRVSPTKIWIELGLSNRHRHQLVASLDRINYVLP